MGGIPERKVRRVMAKKDKNEFSYGASFLPEGEKKYSVIQWGWNGLNADNEIDTGQLTDMSGISCELPYLETQKQAKVWIDFSDGIPVDHATVYGATLQQGVPISIAGFDNQLVMVWEYAHTSGGSTSHQVVVSRFKQVQDDILIKQSDLKDYSFATTSLPRCVVQYNVVTDPNPNPDGSLSGNIAAYTYDRKLLVYRDGWSIPYAFDNGSSWDVEAYAFNTPLNPLPVTDLAAVYNSRVFGGNENSVFASDYNSYAAYNLDTADDVSPAHAWWSMTNGNTEADGSITAMCSYDNHVVLFKKDFMQLVYNNKNPFRIVDVGNFGCVSNKAWAIVNGVLYFASQEKIYAYTGGTPKVISEPLAVDDFSRAALGAYQDKLYVAVGSDIYTFCKGAWSHIIHSSSENIFRIRQFATLDFGLVALAEYAKPIPIPNEFKLLLIDWDTDFLEQKPNPANWKPDYSGEWWFETDLMALGKLDIRRVKKFSMLCEGEENANVKVYLMKDGDEFDAEKTQKVGEITLSDDGYHLMRILTRQFSSTMHKLRFTGTGYVKIHAAELKIAWGGDVYVEG